MRITTLSFHGHPILGNLYLDFTDPETKQPYNTVVLAGENGCGKTIILEAIYQFFAPQGGLLYNLSLEGILSEAEHKACVTNLGANFPLFKDGRLELATSGPTPPENTGTVRFTNQLGEETTRHLHEIINPHDTRRRPFRVFLSEANVGFSVPSIATSGTSALDQEIPSRRSGANLGTEITQLLVDIQSEDNADLAEWVEQHPGSPVPEGIKGVRMKRFKDAITFMFPTKNISRVERSNGQMNIIFEHFGRRHTLGHLSTGEKQIVFRGGFILRDQRKMEGSIALIDEPELSLHPAWQSRILQFYQKILNVESPGTQLIVATHSPFIVHQQVNTKVIILTRNDVGDVVVAPEPQYPISIEARVADSFNVQAYLQMAESDMVLFCEGETDSDILATAWDKLRPGQKRFFDIKIAYSSSQIRTLLGRDEVYGNAPQKKLIGLFDFDNAYNDWNGTWANGQCDDVNANIQNGLLRKHKTHKGWAMLLPVPTHRSYMASTAMGGASTMSIEFLFEDTDHIPGLVKEEPLPSPGAKKKVIVAGKKVPFATHVKSLGSDRFESFKEIFERLEDIQAAAV